MKFKSYLAERKSYESMGSNPFAKKVLRVFETGPGTNSGSPMLRHIEQIDDKTFEFTDKNGNQATLILRSNAFVVYSKGRRALSGRDDDQSFELLRNFVWGMNS